LVVGCQQHHFQTETDFRRHRAAALDCGPNPPDEAGPASGKLPVNDVRTVLTPEAPKREISLAECFALALENGRTGEFFDREGGRRTSIIGLSRGASPSNATDSLRVFAYDPAIAAADIEQSLAKFDAFLQANMAWQKTDRPVGTALDTFFSNNRNAIEQDIANFQTAIVKPLPTGGLAGITFNTDYELNNLGSRVNPSYRPSVALTFEQPLLQGFGVGMNQLMETHPGSIRSNLQIPIGGRVPGILLARIFADEANVEFERRVMDLLFSVEEAYWELYAAYWDLYSREIGVRQGHAAWQRNKNRYDAGQIAIQDLAQIEDQYYSFRAQRLQAMGTGTGRPGVLAAERRLRYMLGLPHEDGTRLVPSDAPTITPFRPNWLAAYNEGLVRRPELIQVRQEIQAAQLAVLRLQNLLLPDVRAFGSYSIDGLGNKLDGSEQFGNAIGSLSNNQFQQWSMGLQGRLSLGFRDAHAQVTKAQLTLAQHVAFLVDQEQKLAFNLAASYQRLAQTHELIKLQRARRLAAATQLEGIYKKFLVGSSDATIVQLLDAQRNFADALRDEHFAIADYQIALVDFERQKGSIMEYNNVQIAQGPVPTCVAERASAHFRDRARSIHLFTPGPCDGLAPACAATPCEAVPMPRLREAMPVPQLMQEAEALPAAPSALPRLEPPPTMPPSSPPPR
jgi:outer membrane protein TolC